MSAPRLSLRTGYFSILGAISIWVGWMLSTRFLASGMLTAYDITALRFLFAGVVLAPVAWRKGLSIGPLGIWGTLLLVFFLGPPYTLICATGMQYAPASHASTIVNGFMVLTSTLFGAYWLKEPFPLQKKIGVGTLLFGMGCVAYAKIGGSASIGHVLFMLGGIMWAGYGLALRRWNVSSWHATAATCVLSAILYLPPFFLFFPSKMSEASLGFLTLHGVYQGLLTSTVALFLYGRAIQILGASTTAAFVPLVPMLTMVLGIPLLGEIPGPLEIAGVVFVFFGLMVVVYRPPRQL